MRHHTYIGENEPGGHSNTESDCRCSTAHNPMSGIGGGTGIISPRMSHGYSVGDQRISAHCAKWAVATHYKRKAKRGPNSLPIQNMKLAARPIYLNWGYALINATQLPLWGMDIYILTLTNGE